MVLFGLQPHRMEPDPTYEVHTLSFNFILPNTAKLGTFLNVYAKKKDEVNDVEHIVFLLYWLCHHVAYCRSKKIIKAY